MNFSKIKNIIKESLIKLEEDTKGCVNFAKANKPMIVIFWFFILLAYGIKLFWYSISIDTEVVINDYQGQMNSWISIGRFGLVVTKKFFGLVPFNPYAATFLMLCMIAVLCFVWSYLFKFLNFDENKKNYEGAVFSALFITAPLFAEQFNFLLQGFEVAFAIALCAVALFFISAWILDSQKIIHLFLAIVCMVWGFASYQAVLSLYISGALACYILIYISNKKGRIDVKRNFFVVSAIKYATTFVVGYFVYILLNKLTGLIYGTTQYLDNSVLWGKVPAKTCIKNILEYIKQVIKADNIFYSKLFAIVIVVLIIYAVANLFSKNKNRILFLLSIIMMAFSPFLLAVYMGQGLFARSQFSLQFVTAFGVYLVVSAINGRKIKGLIIIISFFIALNQGYTVSRLLYTDYMKYQSEVALAQEIYSRISKLSEMGEETKPVVFVGSYHPNNTPSELMGEVIGRSFFEWDATVPFGSNYRISGFMKTIGYPVGQPYVSPSQDQIDRGRKIAEDMQCWPHAGSVRPGDDIIVVKLSGTR